MEQRWKKLPLFVILLISLKDAFGLKVVLLQKLPTSGFSLLTILSHLMQSSLLGLCLMKEAHHLVDPSSLKGPEDRLPLDLRPIQVYHYPPQKVLSVSLLQFRVHRSSLPLTMAPCQGPLLWEALLLVDPSSHKVPQVSLPLHLHPIIVVVYRCHHPKMLPVCLLESRVHRSSLPLAMAHGPGPLLGEALLLVDHSSHRQEAHQEILDGLFQHRMVAEVMVAFLKAPLASMFLDPMHMPNLVTLP
ncbi:hypothetical protein F2P79_002136 [Pimephales promelas]|nr:hypothetical protein F2P79_002136 [Pimephales promelas]